MFKSLPRFQRVAFKTKTLDLRLSPGLPRHFKHDEVTAMEYGHDDEEDQEQETDEEDDGLNDHSCQSIATKKANSVY